MRKWWVVAAMAAGLFGGGADAAILAAGEATACAELDGRLSCWGFNPNAAFVPNVGTKMLTPQSRPGIPLDAEVVMGYDHACAVTADSHLVCWGRNEQGKLGLGVVSSTTEPPTDLGRTDIAAVALGGSHTCALTQNGEVWCWGDNASDQLGIPGPVDQPTPTLVPLPEPATSVATGQYFTCATLQSKKAMCWGFNNHGQVGNGAVGASSLPVEVVGLTDAEQVEAGDYFACALRTGGKVSCWGNNQAGQVTGVASSDPVLSATEVPTIAGAGALSVGGWFACVVDAAAAVRCWGENTRGQLGQGMRDTPPFSPVVGIGPVSDLVTGWLFACVREVAGPVKCWGSNALGELGIGISGKTQTTATSVLTQANDIDAGRGHTCALETGIVYCWGKNDRGQLGLGFVGGDRSYPSPVVGVTDALAVATGAEHSCAIRANGQVACWGSDAAGQMGKGFAGADSPAPSEIANVSNALSLSAGRDHACVVREDSTVMCWGSNTTYQTGSAESGTQPATASYVPGLQDAKLIAAAGDATCAVVGPDSKVYCWGGNGHGELGQGATGAPNPNPVQVATVPPLEQITAGNSHFCGRTVGAFAAIYCWGNDEDGQVGNGAPATPDVSIPAAVRTSFNNGLFAGANATCLKEGAATYCWGGNDEGKLGLNGMNYESVTPVTLYPQATKIVFGDEHSCALLPGGSVACTGSYRNGQHGDGILGYAAVPVEVSPSLLRDSFEARPPMQ